MDHKPKEKTWFALFTNINTLDAKFLLLLMLVWTGFLVYLSALYGVFGGSAV